VAKKPALKMVTPAKKPVAKKSAPAAKKPVAKTMAAPKQVAKPVAQKKQATAPVKMAPRPAMKPALKAVQPTAAKPLVKKEPPKATAAKKDFRVGHHVVYPTHGVGRIVAEETQEIGGITLKLLVIAFDKDRMTLRVPVSRATAAGLRHVSGSEQMKKVFETLKGKPRVSRGMWSRRAQEYDAKINSGNILLIAEVVRDLHANVDQAERSYSERMIYESALNRVVGELAAAEGTDHKTAND
jgi:CarD family transcriptional regulator